MRHLLLVRHAAPIIEPGVPAARWRLSEAGHAAAASLAKRLTHYSISTFATSLEPKAVETATILAAPFRKPVDMYGGLHEHERSQVPLLGKDQFAATMARFFRRQKELVFGDETAAQARNRFAAAIETVVRMAHGKGDLLVVTHGTVLTLFVAAHNPIEPFTFWRGLALPDLIALRLPDYTLSNDDMRRASAAHAES
ncbi:MAG: histidine phosphatase family protein [Ktedonobacterales bacterium]